MKLATAAVLFYVGGLFFLNSAVDQNVMKEKKQDKVKSSSPLRVVVVFRGILEVI